MWYVKIASYLGLYFYVRPALDGPLKAFAPHIFSGHSLCLIVVVFQFVFDHHNGELVIRFLKNLLHSRNLIFGFLYHFIYYFHIFSFLFGRSQIHNMTPSLMAPRATARVASTLSRPCGHMKCRGSWVPPVFLLALSRTLSLSSDLWSRQSVPEVSCDRHSVAWPCLPRFRIPETPCSPRVCLVVSKSWLVQYPVLLPDIGSALLDFDTYIESYHTPTVVSALASNPNGEFVCVLCLHSLCFYSFTVARPTIQVND